jgi:hypothetical protein
MLLLDTAQRFGGKKRRCKDYPRIVTKNLHERVFLQLLEDLEDPSVTSPSDLLELIQYANSHSDDFDNI